ncbi:MAG: YjbH domain-containing protein [Alphaproteobacteria bacterium]|nr:YjbH domain-containing protein [Alphaproteobacteria bacterium]
MPTTGRCLPFLLGILGAVWFLTPPPSGALARQAYTSSVSDYGGVGLMQTRNARFGDEGMFVIGASFAAPYHRYFFSVHGLPGIEAAFRYTTVQNRSIGGGSRNGTTAYQDKGADIKLRLLNETEWQPEVAIGLQDVIGTAQNGAEYIVASKRFYDVDFSLGIGWGRLGTRGHLPNPLGLLSKGFKTREGLSDGSRGGTVSLGQFFAGENVALFGGIEWLTPIDGLRLKVEYDPNNYQEEALQNDLDAPLPINFGVVYQPFSWLDLGVGFERGTTVMLRAAMTPNFHTATPILKIDTPPLPVAPRQNPAAAAAEPPAEPARREWVAEDAADRLFDGLAALGLVVDSIEFSPTAAIVTVAHADPAVEVDWDAAARVVWDAVPSPLTEVTLANRDADGMVSTITLARGATELALALGVTTAEVSGPAPAPDVSSAEQARLGAIIAAAVDAEAMSVDAVRIERRTAQVWIRQTKYRRTIQAVGRVARIVAAVAPPAVEEITIINLTEGVETSRVTLLRSDLEDATNVRGSAEEMFAHTTIAAGDGAIPDASWQPEGRYPAFDWSLFPQYRQHIGGPDAFYLFEVWGQLGAEVELLRGLKIKGSSGLSLYSQFDKLKTNAGGRLPRVRSLLDSYLKNEVRPIVDLYTSYVTGLAPDWYAAVYGGFLEEMYAGVGGEVLYRPFDSRVAVGLDLNHVWQRNFAHLAGFLGYNVTTGHVSLYYDSPFWDLQGTVRVGRYLAGDIGTTLELSRAFDSGLVLGAFASFTNVSAREFGEGSFDKGFFVSIPIDLFFLRPTKEMVRFAFRPLTRDGGQPLSRPVSLYPLTKGDRLGHIGEDWPSVLQ